MMWLDQMEAPFPSGAFFLSSETVWVVANLLARLMQHSTNQLGRISTFSKSNRSNKNGIRFLLERSSDLQVERLISPAGSNPLRNVYSSFTTYEKPFVCTTSPCKSRSALCSLVQLMS